MERTWKRRYEWPKIMTLQDVCECVPHINKKQARELLRTKGTKKGNSWVITRFELTLWLDGDPTWELTYYQDRCKEILRKLAKFPPDHVFREPGDPEPKGKKKAKKKQSETQAAKVAT